MFLSKGHRDLRFAFQTHPGSQASCRREAKDSALLSSRDGHLLEPTLWPKGSQASCEVWREDLGLAILLRMEELDGLIKILEGEFCFCLFSIEVRLNSYIDLCFFSDVIYIYF